VPTEGQTSFADADGESTVDQDHFGAFQACFAGVARTGADGCECFDRPAAGFPHGDNDVDLDDLARFAACASDFAIPLGPACAS
jgi:hypothetical protein